MKILAIETSCDETSVGIVDKTSVIANIISSQIKWHQPYGGVVPSIARRQHKIMLPKVIDQALKQAKIKTLAEIDVLAVTQGPGLAIALEVGLNKAKELAEKYHKPLVGVNHMEGHLLSFLGHPTNQPERYQIDKISPFLGLLISGGHSQMVWVEKIGRYQIIGRTLDDALGEAYDKIGRMLGLAYPAGPALEKLSRLGQAKYELPIPLRLKGNLDFSFAGLKTAVLYLIRKHCLAQAKKCRLKDIASGQISLDRDFINDIAASFQKTVEEVLTFKLNQAITKYPQIKGISLGGGVANNQRIRQAITEVANKHNLDLFLPYTSSLYSDNGAMIGIAGYFNYLQGKEAKDFTKLDRQPNLLLAD